MARRGLAKVVLDAVYRLSCIVIRDRGGDFWKHLLEFCECFWLLLEVDLHANLRLPPAKLIDFYSKVGYTACEQHSVPITFIEPWRKRWMWAIETNPDARRQMWLEVVVAAAESEHSRVVSGAVLAELRRPVSTLTVVGARFEGLLGRDRVLALLLTGGVNLV